MIIELQLIDFPLRLIQCLNIYLLEIGSILYGRIKPIQIMLENIYDIWLIYIPSMARYFHVSRRVQGF